MKIVGIASSRLINNYIFLRKNSLSFCIYCSILKKSIKCTELTLKKSKMKSFFVTFSWALFFPPHLRENENKEKVIMIVNFINTFFKNINNFEGQLFDDFIFNFQKNIDL